MEGGSPCLSKGLLVEILVRLPVQALLRLMAVCKSWKSIVTSPEFCSLHLSRNRHTSKILLTTRDRRPFSPVDEIPKQSYLLLNDDEHLPADPSWLAPFDFPFKCPDMISHHILGSINGLICISLIPSYFCVAVEANITIVLWNPTIRRCVCLPEPNFSYMHTLSIQFGYDSTTDDYKIVVIRRVGGSTTTTTTPALEFHIYSLNSHAWRGGFKMCPPAWTGERGDGPLFRGTGALAGGKMHWVVSVDINCNEVEFEEFVLLSKIKRLYSFDVEEEVFAEMALPQPCEFGGEPVVTVVRDSLHLVHPTIIGSPLTTWTIWVKMDAGGSCDMYWKKLYSVNVNAVFVCFLKNGELLMDKYPTHPDDHGVFAAYDPRARQFKDLEPLSLSQQRAYGRYSVRSSNHQESLVLLDR
ncbi:Unknown protein [Striga hermonthica]|uniref:F-box domain-containing protein n=1 Tax=Striga hermonthica TaxID=68872 RepID=A0A9N7R1S7_STRHE|nr:Unknown protein [Striga hermonthica]